MSQFDLAGEVAVVTGVLGQLGAVWTETLLRAGAQVVGVDRRADAGPRLAGVLAGQEPGRFHLLRADVTSHDELTASLCRCRELAGEPTVLVNNAGIDQPPSAAAESWEFEGIPREISSAVLEVNALGVLAACQVFGGSMARRGRGTIVNIGSLYGGVAPDHRYYEHLPSDPPFIKPPAYGMSKAAVAALSRYLAALWGPAGVRVNTLSPGGVLGGQDGQFLAKFTARVPLGRMAEPADLSGPLLFLASDLSQYVTGQELLVDGGYTCL